MNSLVWRRPILWQLLQNLVVLERTCNVDTMVGGLKIIMKRIMNFELALLKAYIILFTYLRMHD